MAALTVGQCLAVNGVRIKNPPSGNLVSGHSQTFSGDMLAARHGANPNWTVDYPTVRLEFWWWGSIPCAYLMTSTETAMAFPVPAVTTGAWSGSLTIDQVGPGWVYPYELYAIPLDPFNEPNYGLSDVREFAVVSS